MKIQEKDTFCKKKKLLKQKIISYYKEYLRYNIG